MSTITPVQTLVRAGALAFIHRGNLLIAAIDTGHPDMGAGGWAQHLTFVLPAGADLAKVEHDFQPHLTDAARQRREDLGPLTLESLLKFQDFIEGRLVSRWRENAFPAELCEIEEAGLRVVLPLSNSRVLRKLFEPRKARGRRRSYGVKYDHELDELAAVVNQEAEQQTVLPSTLLGLTDIQSPVMVVDKDGDVVAWLGYFPEGLDEVQGPQWVVTPLSWMSAERFWQDVIDYAGVEFGDLGACQWV